MSKTLPQDTAISVHPQFNEAAMSRSAVKPKPCYITVRVTPEEKARLQREAAGVSLSEYVRDRLLGDDARPRKSRGKFPVKDYEALSRVLRALGKANLYNNLHVLMLAMTERRLALDPALEKDLRETHRIVGQMRDNLVIALGLSPKKPHSGRYAKPPGG